MKEKAITNLINHKYIYLIALKISWNPVPWWLLTSQVGNGCIRGGRWQSTLSLFRLLLPLLSFCGKGPFPVALPFSFPVEVDAVVVEPVGPVVLPVVPCPCPWAVVGLRPRPRPNPKGNLGKVAGLVKLP